MKTDVNTSSVDKAFVLLEFLAASGRPATLQEVTESVKIPKPTAYRLLRVLQGLGYVSRPAGGRSYLVGPRTARLAASDPHAGLKAAAQPVLRRLHGEFNETVNLGALSGTQVLYLDFLETTQPLRFIVTPGQSDSYFSTALGRAVAAQMNDHELDRLLAETPVRPLTSHTVKTRADLRRRIVAARTNGYAEEIQESVQGVCCLAVSLAALGFPGAAVSVAIPAERLTPKRKVSLIAALKEAVACPIS